MNATRAFFGELELVVLSLVMIPLSVSGELARASLPCPLGGPNKNLVKSKPPPLELDGKRARTPPLAVKYPPNPWYLIRPTSRSSLSADSATTLPLALSLRAHCISAARVDGMHVGLTFTNMEAKFQLSEATRRVLDAKR